MGYSPWSRKGVAKSWTQVSAHARARAHTHTQCQENGYTHTKESSLSLTLHHIQKVTQNESKEKKKRIKDLKVGPKTIKLLEEGKKLPDISFGNYFLNITPIHR